MIPGACSSIYTGREELLQELKSAIFDLPSRENFSPNCFVIYGLAGSGKSQFCAKFASEYRDK
jgi:signal recognition particle GTPase